VPDGMSRPGPVPPTLTFALVPDSTTTGFKAL
jgi:hypothetical protein